MTGSRWSKGILCSCGMTLLCILKWHENVSCAKKPYREALSAWWILQISLTPWRIGLTLYQQRALLHYNEKTTLMLNCLYHCGTYEMNLKYTDLYWQPDLEYYTVSEYHMLAVGFIS